MTADQKGALKEFAIAALIILIVLWFFHHVSAPASSTASPLPDVGLTVPPLAAAVANENTPPDNCACHENKGCPISPVTVASVNQMIQIGQVFANEIENAGNATIDAIAAIGKQENPLLTVTKG